MEKEGLSDLRREYFREGWVQGEKMKVGICSEHRMDVFVHQVDASFVWSCAHENHNVPWKYLQLHDDLKAQRGEKGSRTKLLQDLTIFLAEIDKDETAQDTVDQQLQAQDEQANAVTSISGEADDRTAEPSCPHASTDALSAPEPSLDPEELSVGIESISVHDPQTTTSSAKFPGPLAEEAPSASGQEDDRDAASFGELRPDAVVSGISDAVVAFGASRALDIPSDSGERAAGKRKRNASPTPDDRPTKGRKTVSPTATDSAPQQDVDEITRGATNDDGPSKSEADHVAADNSTEASTVQATLDRVHAFLTREGATGATFVRVLSYWPMLSILPQAHGMWQAYQQGDLPRFMQHLQQLTDRLQNEQGRGWIDYAGTLTQLAMWVNSGSFSSATARRHSAPEGRSRALHVAPVSARNRQEEDDLRTALRSRPPGGQQ